MRSESIPSGVAPHRGAMLWERLLFHPSSSESDYEVCGYGGEDGEERLLSLLGQPRAHKFKLFPMATYYVILLDFCSS